MSDIIRKHQKKGATNGLKMGVHKSRSGGLTEAGRNKINRETGSHLKAPQPEGGPRKRSFCARSAGQAKKFPEAAKDPNSRLSLARKRWNC